MVAKTLLLHYSEIHHTMPKDSPKRLWIKYIIHFSDTVCFSRTLTSVIKLDQCWALELMDDPKVSAILWMAALSTRNSLWPPLKQ